ncbi:hypothetical protein MPLB_1490084 [Mesorhizobium sp. ORS 3324]|nr:hypothetical protein MPLB_1490084 [Mesorhizobium sp. ORS 3324]
MRLAKIDGEITGAWIDSFALP